MKATPNLSRLISYWKTLTLHAQIQKLEALEKTCERKRDTRRKILVGAYYLDKAKSSSSEMQMLQGTMAEFLTRDNDRVLFELPLLETAQATIA
ncbi:hypothetical protein BH10PSE19_BH10PSE19_04760 [soil metagenome]